ncbi:MAG: LON peptidase substrate-binding domain-containing protein [Akkermansiaceae bacterium]|nr:LON peptidase substrate-binding domain-containing protein [Akkermansiaceae bacterium]NNM30928.1 LON peptidase substrate-binding domain-containing protein [Akkermansiaceae bacterium]
MSSIELPSSAGAILLPETTLFPHGALPLHVFEDRYRQMLVDALEGNCLFCVARLLGEETDDPSLCTDPIGTIGLIRASRELPDGRSHLVLHGVCRVRFAGWGTEKPYPYADIVPFESIDVPTPDAPEHVKRLRDAVSKVLSSFPPEVMEQVNELLDRAGDPFIMADAVAQQFVHDQALRQALLEEPEVATRIDLIVDHLRSLRQGES